MDKKVILAVNSNKNQYKFDNSTIVKFIMPIALFFRSCVYRTHKLQKHIIFYLEKKKKSLKGRLKWLSYVGITMVTFKLLSLIVQVGNQWTITVS